MLAEIAPLLDHLPDALHAPRDPDTVFIPWHGWALTTDDFLVTRSMELVVHSDDLAASVGLPTPDFPDTIAAHVVDLLGRSRDASPRPGSGGTCPEPAAAAPASVSAF